MELRAEGLLVRCTSVPQRNEPEKAEPGARANDHGCHAACVLKYFRLEKSESGSESGTQRASHGRGSSLTLGKTRCHGFVFEISKADDYRNPGSRSAGVGP